MRMLNDALFTGHYVAELWRAGRLIERREGKNGIVDLGRRYILDICFGPGNGQEQRIGLTLNTFTPDDANDDLSDLSGYDFTDYTDPDDGDSATTRPLWLTGAAAKVSTNIEITNAIGQPHCRYDITSGGTIKGIFVTDVASKSTYTSGLFHLWATANFTSPIAVVASDTLKVSYTVRTPAA